MFPIFKHSMEYTTLYNKTEFCNTTGVRTSDPTGGP
jgi:hypothetical protein